MLAYTKPQHRKKEESEQLKGEREIRSSLLILNCLVVWLWCRYCSRLREAGVRLGQLLQVLLASVQ